MFLKFDALARTNDSSRLDRSQKLYINIWNHNMYWFALHFQVNNFQLCVKLKIIIGTAKMLTWPGSKYMPVCNTSHPLGSCKLHMLLLKVPWLPNVPYSTCNLLTSYASLIFVNLSEALGSLFLSGCL